MARYIAIVGLCLALVLCNTGCGKVGDESEQLDPPDNWERVFNIRDTGDGVEVWADYCVKNVRVGDVACPYLVAGYLWEIAGIHPEDIDKIEFDGGFVCENADYERVGQVSYKLEKGTYIFCSDTRVIEAATLTEAGVYRMKHDSDVSNIYEVIENE